MDVTDSVVLADQAAHLIGDRRPNHGITALAGQGADDVPGDLAAHLGERAGDDALDGIRGVLRDRVIRKLGGTVLKVDPVPPVPEAPAGAGRAVLKFDLPDGVPLDVGLARAILTLAAQARMPDEFWETDSRTVLACQVLCLTPAAARRWAQDKIVEKLAWEPGA